MQSVSMLKAMRVALTRAKQDYDVQPRDTLANVIAYLAMTVRTLSPPRPTYQQLPMFAVYGRPTGKYHCQQCGERFGENDVSPLQSRRAYLTLHCPHCGQCWYTDNSQ